MCAKDCTLPDSKICSALFTSESYTDIWLACHIHDVVLLNLQVGSISGHSMPINQLCFTHLGHHLVTVSDDRLIKVATCLVLS